jgi:serine/threonine-protein kinase
VSGDYYHSMEIVLDDGPTVVRRSNPWDEVTTRVEPPALEILAESERSNPGWIESETNIWDPPARVARGSNAPTFSDEPAHPIPMRRLPSQDIPRNHSRPISVPFLDLEPDVEPADPRIGTAIGPYRIIRPIGVGGMGIVYLARHDRLNRQVAIKFLHPSQAASEDHVKRFLGEAIAANAIGEAGVPAMLDYGTTSDGSAYLIMELLRGLNLDARLDDFEPMTVAEHVDVARHVAQTLTAAHLAGIIHRDLKPSNIFLVDRGADQPPGVKVLDFGAAKFFGTLPATTHTAHGRIIGTPGYMAPEQISLRPSIDPRADIYALGCLLYRMLCGRTPFTGTTQEVLKAHRKRPPIAPTKFNPDIPRRLEKLILRLLAKNPAERPQTMTVVAVELQAIYRSLA